MAERTGYAPGTPSWVDCGTPDPEAARAFYTELFGWTAEIGPPETGGYTTFRLRGKAVAGLYGYDERMRQTGAPPGWTTYIASADADGAATAVGDAGGTVLVGPVDVLDMGRMLLARDPAGAVFGVWQAGRHTGAQLVDETGALCWSELYVRDIGEAERFYTQVFGWTYEPMDIGGPQYRTAKAGDAVVCGVFEMDASFPPDVPPNWLPYFAVEDTDAAAGLTTRRGGHLYSEPMETSFGRFAILGDPQDVPFAVIQPAPTSAE